MRGRDTLQRAVREAVGFYWGSGLSNEVPALAWSCFRRWCRSRSGSRRLTRLLVPVASIALTTFICAGVYRVLSGGAARWRSALLGGLVGGVLLQVTPTLAGYYLRYVAGNTPVELFLMLSGVLIYLAALALLIGAGVTMRLQLGRSLGEPRDS